MPTTKATTPEVALTLGEKLSEMVDARGLSVARAATMCGMTRQQLWRILQGDIANPGVLTVQGIVTPLGYSMRDLFSEGNLVREVKT